MKQMNRFKIVLITAPDIKTARRLARAALLARLIACANLVPKIESHYRWQGKIEKSTEVFIICKTTTGSLARFQKLVQRLHPYDTPEFVVLKISSGSARYLKWLGECCPATG